MLVRFGLILAFLVASATSLAKETNQMSASFKDALHNVAIIYKVHDCDSDLSEQAEQNLIEACTDAFAHPDVAATHGAMSCTYDMENFTVSAKTTVASPNYKISSRGDVRKISKGDLTVTSGQCQDLAKSQDEDEVATHHPATEDLCLGYYPDKHFSEYQDKSECSDRGPAATSQDDEEDADPANVAVDTNDIDRAAAMDLSTYDSALLSQK